MTGQCESPVRCAVVGYGPHHRFGRAHGRWIETTPGLAWVAVCDRDPGRLEAAKEEYTIGYLLGAV